MASEDDNAECDAVMEKEQESKKVYAEDGKLTINIDSDSECEPLVDEIAANCLAKDIDLTQNDLDKDLSSNERTNNSSNNDERPFTECVPSVNESSYLEITSQNNNENRISRSKDELDEENCRNSEEEILELDLADLQSSPALLKPQTSCLDIRNTGDNKDNTSTDNDKDSTSHSVIDLSDHVENTQVYEERDIIDLEGDTCRICHCGDETEVLMSPCLCTGTVKYVHQSCLMDWLKRCVKTKCELCLYNFSVHRKTKPLKKWRRPDQKPTPIIWLLTFVVALTLNIASIAKDGSQKCVSNPCIIFYVVGALGAMLGFAFFYHWLIVSIRYIKQWMALNEEWTLVESDKTKVIKGEENMAASNKSIESKDQRIEVQVV